MGTSKTRPAIAILHYSCPPVVGGVESVIAAHAKLLYEAGHRTRLVVGSGGQVHPHVRTTVIPEITSRGGSVSRVIDALAEGRKPRSFEAAVKRVERLLSNALRGADVCIAHNVMTMHFNLVLTAALANIMRRSRGIRFIIWTHDTTFGEDSYRAYHRSDYPWSLLSTPMERCAYCAISENCRRETARVLGLDKSRITVVPDGIDFPALFGLTDPVRDLFYEERLYNIDVVGLTPARIVRRKNIEAGMDIMVAMKKRNRKVRWIVTGAPDPHNRDDTKYYDELIDLRRRKGLEKEMIFLCERVSRSLADDDLRGLYAVSDMLIFPSAREGFGIPVVEAGLAGMVLVLNDIPALREIAGADAVYIRNELSPDEIAHRALRTLDGSPRLSFRKRMMKEYSWHSIFRKKVLPVIG